jgi:hypothetical protein
MRSKKKLELEKYWRNAVEDWRGSSLNMKQFAEERNLAYKRFCFWRQRFDEQSKPSKVLKCNAKPVLETAAQFAPVCVVGNQNESVKSVNTSSMLEIVLLCGRTVRFNNRCQPEYLSSVVSVLEGC